MKKRLNDIFCVFRIHLARLRRETGPFLLAAIIFPVGMYFFAGAITSQEAAGSIPDDVKRHFLGASIVFSLSLTAVSWLGYLMLENRFTGRLKLFKTLPLAPSSYVFGVLIFALLQGGIGTGSLLGTAALFGVPVNITAGGILMLAIVVTAALLVLGGISVVIAASARSFSEGSLLTDGFGAGMVLLAPVYYPWETLPLVLRSVAFVLPTTYAAAAVNKILTGDLGVGTELSVLIFMAATTLTAGFRVMKWRDE